VSTTWGTGVISIVYILPGRAIFWENTPERGSSPLPCQRAIDRSRNYREKEDLMLSRSPLSGIHTAKQLLSKLFCLQWGCWC
jgi:hypothetical protein